MAVKFPHDIGPVSLRGFYAQIESHGDFLAAFSFGEKLNDFALPWSQADRARSGVLRTRIALQKAVQYHLRNPRREERLVAAQRIHCSDEVPPSVRFQNVSSGAGV